MSTVVCRHGARPMRQRVDWNSYAAVYDLMAQWNPAYQDLLDDLRRVIGATHLRAGDVIVDLGAGTGNFSLTAAAVWPSCRVVHVDLSEEMNARARDKRDDRQLNRVEIRTADVDTIALPDDSVSWITLVHALYALRDPEAVIARCYRWLRPGGRVFAIDPGAPFDVGEWTRYIMRSAAASQGPLRTLAMLWRARAAVRENRKISDAFAQRAYWRHDVATFRQPFVHAGFQVLESGTTYRGVSDRVIAQKPISDLPLPAAQDGFDWAV